MSKPGITQSISAPVGATKDEGVVTFADKAFKSRTIVLSDGRAFPVSKSRITANDAALIAYLDRHADFERTAGQG
ncbi:hypothetical protein [Chitiniphilus shinanonensis]|uniref:hypothetical protein n=1 Tax=Chitiniphilus shinanonensis TaxID=553088 RepID=UPI00303910AF